MQNIVGRCPGLDYSTFFTSLLAYCVNRGEISELYGRLFVYYIFDSTLTVAIIIIIFVNKLSLLARELSFPILLLLPGTMNNISIERSNYRGNKPTQQASRNISREEELLRKSGKADVYFLG